MYAYMSVNAYVSLLWITYYIRRHYAKDYATLCHVTLMWFLTTLMCYESLRVNSFDPKKWLELIALEWDYRI